MKTLDYSKTRIVFKLAELGTIAAGLFWLGYQASQLKTALEDNTKKTQILFKVCWSVRDQISFTDKFRAMNPENKSLWPNAIDIHGEGLIKEK